MLIIILAILCYVQALALFVVIARYRRYVARLEREQRAQLDHATQQLFAEKRYTKYVCKELVDYADQARDNSRRGVIANEYIAELRNQAEQSLRRFLFVTQEVMQASSLHTAIGFVDRPTETLADTCARVPIERDNEA